MTEWNPPATHASPSATVWSGHRVIHVLVECLAIEDGHTAAPVVGDVGEYVLDFREAHDDAADGTVSTFSAQARLLRPPDPTASREVGKVGGSWLTELAGNGWKARWHAPRHVEGGHVTLRGTLFGVWSCEDRERVSGLVTSICVVRETRYANPSHAEGWSRDPAGQHLRRVDRSPRFFSHGLEPDRPIGGGWFTMTAPNPWTAETGVYVSVDLDGSLRRF